MQTENGLRVQGFETSKRAEKGPEFRLAIQAGELSSVHKYRHNEKFVRGMWKIPETVLGFLLDSPRSSSLIVICSLMRAEMVLWAKEARSDAC